MQAIETKYTIGFTSCYIKDHPFIHIAEMPEAAAVAWVKGVCPEVAMGHMNVKAKDLTVNTNYDTDAKGNGWLNKLFIIVGVDHGKWLALANHDGRFGLYMENTPA